MTEAIALGYHLATKFVDDQLKELFLFLKIFNDSHHAIPWFDFFSRTTIMDMIRVPI
jgi:hypothetical protein